jgi:hypothetical protein
MNSVTERFKTSMNTNRFTKLLIADGLAHRWGQYVSPDGKYLFYTRGTSEKDCAIYWVRFDDLLKSLRPKQLKAPAGSNSPM